MKNPLFRHRSRAAQRRRGFTLLETMTSVAVMSTVVVGTMGMFSMGAKTADKRIRENGFTGLGRATMDEVLRETRAGDQILRTFTLNGTSVTSNATTLVVEGPGIDPASQQGILPGVYDVCAFIYDPQAKTIRESTLVGSGSKRASRRDLILARNVQSVEIIYRVRDAVLATGGQKTFVLSAYPSNSTPTVFVNGIAQTSGFTYTPAGSSEGNKPSVTFTAAPGDKADVQFQYTIDPTRNGGADLPYVTTIAYTATMSEGSAPGTITLSGTARLRNSRL
jgi:prepilin-type N-terminal cleavage/methylation domain-containing protein